MRDSREAKRSGPTPLGDVLGETRELSLKRSRAAVDRDTWRRAVGRRIAERTEVGALRGGELTVYVASPAWAQELSLLTTDIRERLAGFGIRVERVRFRLLATPPPAPHRAPPRPQPKKVVPPELAARLARVEDEELRKAIEGAAGLAIGRMESAAGITSTQRAARAPRDAEARSARSDRSSPDDSAGLRGRRGARRG
nr:MAG: hypothetical protein DIU78_06200 [Pseudomonadota bacterium]